MKILHVIPSVSPIRGGPSQAILEMVRSLIAQGIESSIVTTDDDGPDRLNVSTDNWINYQGVPVHFFPRFSPNSSGVREFAFSRELTIWLYKNIDSYDLVHVHAIFSYPSTVAMAIARWRGVPYICRSLGQLCDWSLRQSPLKKQIYLKLIERTNINCSQGLHLTSEQEKKEAAKLNLACPTFVVPHGLNFAPPVGNSRHRLREKFGLPEEEKIILFLSRIHPKKGLNFLISALGQLVEYSFTFILAGSGDPVYESEVRSLLKASGIDSRTILPGFVEGETKNTLLQGADLYALTSYSENFGVAVLEALAAGLATVVTPGVALSDEIHRYQLGYVSQLHEDAIRDTLENCLKSPEVSVKMGKRAQQFVIENYTWQRNADNLIEIYRSIIEERPIVQHTESNYASYSHLQ